MSLFQRKTIHFKSQNPLDNGLGDDIAAEQGETESFLNDVSGDDLTNPWNAVVKDFEEDPNWFTFNED